MTLSAAKPSGRQARLAGLVAVGGFALAGALTWPILATGVAVLPSADSWLLWLIVGYACFYAVVEVLNLPVGHPSLNWQVPAPWVRGTITKRLLVWSMILGPGFATRNPYAGFWLIFGVVALTRPGLELLALASLTGAAHGGMRAIGTMRNRCAQSPYAMIVARLRWRHVDGFALAIMSGLAVGYAMASLG